MSSVICELRRKFRLLVSYGHAVDLDEIAQRLNTKVGTMLWWADGDSRREPGTVPEKDFQAVLTLFLEVLVPPMTSEQAILVILGSARILEDHLRTGNAKPFIHFVRTEGDNTASKLICQADGDMGLVETTLPQDKDGDVYPVKAGQYFRIMIERDLRHRQILALQHTHMIWAQTPHTVDAKTGHVHLPGMMAHGSPAVMKEERDLGHNLFLVVALHDPLPAEISAYLKNQAVFDVPTLGKLVGHYESQPLTRRGIFTLAVYVEGISSSPAHP